VGDYLKAAFWISPRVPGLGRLPLNALALLGLFILGFGHPGFWLLGLALEAAWLYGATQSDRFRQLVDARAELLEDAPLPDEKGALTGRLSAENRQLVAALDAKCARALELQRHADIGDLLLDMNRDALDKLTCSYAKLLVARESLQSLGGDAIRRDLQQKVTQLERELEASTSPTLRESKEATLRILQQRLAHVERREVSLAEIQSDLMRVEAQVDLAIDNAGLRGKDSAISADIHFVSQFLDDATFPTVRGWEADSATTASTSARKTEPPVQ
jgi:hypothetical protein